MSHLGERLTALVDGELEHDERDRAYAHLAGCAACRGEAEALRRLKGELRSLDEAVPPDAFLTRLYAMDGGALRGGSPGGAMTGGESRSASGSATSAGAMGDAPGGWDPDPAGRGSQALPGGMRPSTRRGQRAGQRAGRRAPAGSRPTGGDRPRRGPSAVRSRYLAMGAATLAVLGMGTASVVANGGPERLPQVAPALERFAVEYVLTTGGLPAPETTPVADRHSRP